MTVGKAFGIVVGSAVGFGVAGGVLGLLLGVIAPDYYRLFFERLEELQLNPVQFGLAIGIVQGAIWGMVIGLIIVLAATWSDTRRDRTAPSRTTPGSDA